QQLRDELRSEDKQIEICSTDASRREEVDRLIQTTLDKFGRSDILVYATGTNLPDRSLTRLTADNWEMMLAVNLSGAFHCTQAVLPEMRQAGGGLIIYLSSGAVQRADVSGVAYQASKHGLTGLAHGTRVEEKDNGIRTSVI